jgi:YHS domain-containing protein
MSTDQTNITSGEVKQAETACGARILVTPNTSYIKYKDEIVYFCGQDCKEIYDADPMNSCMAARLLSGR